MNISIHINFDGRCTEAFKFYEEHLGGVIDPILSYRDSPASANVPEEWQDKIVHGSIAIDKIELAGTDILPPEYHIPRGFWLLQRLSSEHEVQKLFEIFKEDGEIVLAPQKTFWSPCYAIVNDRFGVPWKFNCVV